MKYILITTALFFGLFSCSENGKEEQRNKNVTPVRVQKIKREIIIDPVRTTGKLAPASEIRLSFKIGGLIEKIVAEEGQTIEMGQLMARLDQSEIEARYIQAESAFEKAERDFNRIERLYADSVATNEQFQNARTALNLAEADLSIAEFNLKHSVIKAPAAGKILKQFPEENEIIAAGQPVFLFGSTAKAWILRAGITDQDILRLSIGDSAQVFFDAYPQKTFFANVTRLGAAANPMTGLFETELTMDPAAVKLIAGFVARIKIYPRQTEKLFTIPVDALVEADGQRGYIFLVNSPDDSVAREQAVEVVTILKDKIAIQNAFPEESLVITDGANYLRDKAAIRIVNR